MIQEAYITAFDRWSTTRQGDGATGVSRAQVQRLCEEINERVKAFLDRPLEGDSPYVC